jgi:serine/threonine protein kinase
MVFEPYAGREIKYRLQELVTASERVIAELLYKLLQAVNHCHSKNVFHRYLIGTTKRDIKFDSIFHRFPTSLTEICLANFSTADIYDAKTKGQFKKIGTPGYLLHVK